jgi:uncharacterized protein DUF6941
MKLDWAMLANYAEVREGLVFVTGGGIDTVQTQQLPAVLNATILVRLLLHRTEANKQHSLELEITDEDGNTIAKVQAGVMVPVAPDVPVGWDIPSMVALNIHGLQLAKEGRYAVEISADNVHLRTLNLRTKVNPYAPGPPTAPSQPAN